MSITYQCEHCSRWYTVRENKVGTRARCGDCGHEMTVPDTPDLFDDAIDGPLGGAAPIRGRGPLTSTGPTGRRVDSGPSGGDEGSGRAWGGLGVAGFILILVLRLAVRGPMLGGRPKPARRPPPAAPAAAEPVDLDGPIRLPERFPDLGPPREIEPGVQFREAVLPDAHPSAPGHAGRLWLYLPGDRGAPRPGPGSLPCVLIAPGGGSPLCGMKLDHAQRPEHLPYVRAGFAVLAFELDGANPFPNPRGLPTRPSMAAFLRARAGLVNGEVARAFLRAKVPEVDLGRLYVAGRDSGGALALRFAEDTPYAKGCVAYAPLVDLAARVDAARQETVRKLGFGDLVARFSPRNGEARLGCPVFLFHSREDLDVPSWETIASATRLRGLHKDVTLDLAESGDHDEALIDDGIPRGVAWLKARDAEVRAGKD